MNRLNHSKLSLWMGSPSIAPHSLHSSPVLLLGKTATQVLTQFMQTTRPPYAGDGRLALLSFVILRFFMHVGDQGGAVAFVAL
jgi:hypothetical protein